MSGQIEENNLSPYIDFGRKEWSRLRASTPLTLTESDLQTLRGINEKIDLAEVEEVYLPISRLLILYVEATQALYDARQTFLGNHDAKVPYIIGVAGSVAVGKSTTSRILQALTSRWPDKPRVDLVSTDSFLYPNKILQERGIMDKKGFPESYDRRNLIKFLLDVKSGKSVVRAPVYSHISYDILEGRYQEIRQPDILIVEGLNVLQTDHHVAKERPQFFVSDFFDLSIYVDAKEDHIKKWYIERFLVFMETAFKDPAAFFHRFSKLSKKEAVETASGIWDTINAVNLRQNIEPTKHHAHLILMKDIDHSIKNIRLRKI